MSWITPLQKTKYSILSITALILLLLLVTGCNSNAAAPSRTAPPASSPSTGVAPEQPVPPSFSPEAFQPPVAESSPAPSQEADALTRKIAGMTLEEKIGQMLLAGIDGTTLEPEAKRMITEDKVGGIILYADNIRDLKGMVNLTNALKKSNTTNPAPLFMSVDQEGGKVSRMPKEYASIPANGKVGSVNDADAAGTMGKLLAREVLAAGFNMNFAPVLDINSNPGNPVIGDRSFGSYASIVSKLGIAEMKGIESGGVVPVVKHFPGHGDTSVDSHLELPVVNKTASQLAKLEWLPFQAAIKEQADAVMVAHILFPKIDPDNPASLSRIIIGDQLRGDMGYQGVVITDDLTMGAIMKHFDLGTAAVESVNAGSDILLIAHGYENEQLARKALLQSVRGGTLDESRINESVYRILALKQKYRLTDKPVPVPDLTELNKEIKMWRNNISK
ncbi:beta-N-acetylhexosaminidase [Paenibacillus graminis]|uniref:beta-N-acetylhexosaminidase n=1 Tax=Paenibacillus graminis TaxID=189425 RepID=UPI00046F6CFF|nr:beta-N-acetylhexosaminidase [Paenibacillus graminis]